MPNTLHGIVFQPYFFLNASSLPICCVFFPSLLLEILLMAEILHQLIGSFSHYLQGFIHPRWCKISAINSIMGNSSFCLVTRRFGVFLEGSETVKPTQCDPYIRSIWVTIAQGDYKSWVSLQSLYVFKECPQDSRVIPGTPNNGTPLW